MTKFTDSNFQQAFSGVHQGGPLIGGAPPTTFYAPVPVLSSRSLFCLLENASPAGGSSYPTGMVYWDRPLPPPGAVPESGTLVLEARVRVTSAYLTDGNAFELDTKLTLPDAAVSGTRTIDGSMQIVGGQIYVTQNKVWVPVPGAKVQLTPAVAHRFEITYGWVSTAGGSVQNIRIDGFDFPNDIPADIAVQNWPPGAVCQFQQSLLPAGRAWAALIEELTYRWPQ